MWRYCRFAKAKIRILPLYTNVHNFIFKSFQYRNTHTQASAPLYTLTD